MTRLSVLFLLGGAGLIASPAAASAQFFGPGLPSAPPVIVPSFNPFFYVPQYRFQSGFGLSVPSAFGRVTVGSSQFYQGVAPLWAAPGAMSFYQPGSAVTIGGSSARPNLALEMQRDLARAQRAAALPGPNPGGGGRNVAAPDAELDRGPAPGGAAPALTPVERARVVSGAALNELLAAAAKVDVRAGSNPSAFVSPLHLSELRFAGSDAADLANLARQAGALKYPAALDGPGVRELRAALDRDLAAVALAVQGGKAPARAVRESFEATAQKVEAALGPVVKAQGFEDAIEARRFVAQLAGAARALKAGAGDGLLDPKWEAQGATVEALARHMNRHKLTFAPAPGGSEEAYTDLHRNLAAYLFALSQPRR